MKKIRLKEVVLEATEILSRDQLKTILGGATLWKCTRAKDNEFTLTYFSDSWSQATIAAWQYAWEGLGYQVYCRTADADDPSAPPPDPNQVYYA
jgi:hypothetical protein